MTSMSQSYLIVLNMCYEYCVKNNTDTFQFDEMIDYFYSLDQITRRLLSRIEKIIGVMIRSSFIQRTEKDTMYGRTFKLTPRFHENKNTLIKNTHSSENISFDLVQLTNREQIVLNACLTYVKETKKPGFTAGDVWDYLQEPLRADRIEYSLVGITISKILCSQWGILEEYISPLKFVYAAHTGGYFYKFNAGYFNQVATTPDYVSQSRDDVMLQLQKEIEKLQHQMNVVVTKFQQLQISHDLKRS